MSLHVHLAFFTSYYEVCWASSNGSVSAGTRCLVSTSVSVSISAWYSLILARLRIRRPSNLTLPPCRFVCVPIVADDVGAVSTTTEVAVCR